MNRTLLFLLYLMMAIPSNGWSYPLPPHAGKDYEMGLDGTHGFPGEWKQMAPLSPLGQDSVHPALSVNQEGKGIACWTLLHDALQIEGAWFSPEKGWQKASPIVTSSDYLGHPQVVLDDRGEALIVWQTERNGQRVLCSCHGEKKGWSEEMPLAFQKGDQAVPHLSHDPQTGVVLAAWSLSQGDNSTVYTSFYKDGHWEEPTAISSEKSYGPVGAVGNDGQAIVLWWSYDEGGKRGEVYASRKKGREWESPIPISRSGRDSCQPVVALDNDGIAYAAWCEKGDTYHLLQAAVIPPEGLPGPSVTLAVDVADCDHPVVKTNPVEGGAHFLWQQGLQIWSRKLNPAGKMGKLYFISRGKITFPGVRFVQPQLAFDHSGVPVAVWCGWDRHEGRYGLFGSPEDEQGCWTPSLIKPAQEGGFPLLAYGGGVFHVLVQEVIDGNRVITAASYTEAIRE